MTVLGRHLRLPLLAALLLALATPALAQYGRPITEREKEGLWRLGPFRLTPLLQLRNAGVDTNPFLTSEGGAEETEVVLRGGVKIYVPVGRRFRFRGDGWLDYTFFSNALEPRKTYPGGDLRAELDISRFTLFAGGGHFYARQRYTSDIDTRIERTEGWVNGGVQYQLTRIFGIDFAAEDRRFRYNAETPEDERIKLLLDRDSLSFQGRFRYNITPLTTLLVTGEILEDTFRYGDPARATTKSYRYLAGFEFGQKAVITGLFLAGVRDIPASSAGTVKPYTGPALRGSLVVPLLEQRLRLGANFTRDVYYSASASLAEDQAVRNTYVYGQWQLSLEFDLPLRFIGRVIGGWQNADYQVPVLLDGVETMREDKAQSYGFSLLRRLGRNARFGVTAMHTTRSSNIPGLDYSRWRYGLSGEFTP